MNRRPSFAVFLCALALIVQPASAQVTTLTVQDALEDAGAVADQTSAETRDEAQDAAEQLPSQQVDTSDYLNPLLEQEWVVLDDQDEIHGLYAVLAPDGEERPLAGVTINLGRNGVIIQSAVTESDGRFTFNGVGIGSYALVAKGPDTVAAFALHVLPGGASDRLDTNFTVVGTSVAGPSVGQIFRAHLVPRDAEPGYYPELEIDPLGESRRFNDKATVQLTEQGVLVGHVSRPSGRRGGELSGNIVHLLKAGQVVAHVPTNVAGEFNVPGLAPGVYDFIVAGKDGVAAGGFQAVAAPGLVQKGHAETQLVSTVKNQDAQPDALNVELVAPIDWLAGEPEFVLPPEEFAPAPIAGGGMVGPGGFGGAGGGGGGGGAGGLGGLLGIAGLAAGIAAAASSNDNGFTIASPQ